MAREKSDHFHGVPVVPAVPTAMARSLGCFVSIKRSRINTAMARCVRFSSLANFFATSRFKSQSGFLGAKFTRS